MRACGAPASPGRCPGPTTWCSPTGSRSARSARGRAPTRCPGKRRRPFTCTASRMSWKTCRNHRVRPVAEKPAATDAGTQLRRLDAAAGALLGVAMLLLLHRYWGIDHDAALYLGQGLLVRWPEIFDNDLFFLHGSQGQYTLFPWLLAQTLDAVDPALLFFWGGFAGLLLFAAAAWHCLSALLPRGARYWAWLGVLCLPSMYGVTTIFSYAEPFLTPRPFAEALCLLCIGLLARGRMALAFACLAAAALLHPLQAIAAALEIGRAHV